MLRDAAPSLCLSLISTKECIEPMMNFEEEEKLRGKPLSVDVCLEVFYSLTRSLKLGPCNLCVYLFHTALSKSTKGQDLSG